MRGRVSINIGKPRLSPDPMLGSAFREGAEESWSSYWTTHLYNESDMSFRISEGTRNRNILPDSINPGLGDAKILPFFYINKGGYYHGDKTRMEERCWDGNDYTISIEIAITSDFGTGSKTIFTVGDTALGIVAIINNKELFVYFGNGTLNSSRRSYFTLSSWLVYGTMQLVCWINRTNGTLSYKLYDIDGVERGGGSNFDISSYGNNNNDNTYFLSFQCDVVGVGNFKKFIGIKTLSNCRDDSYYDGLQLHYPIIEGQVDLASGKNLIGSVHTSNVNRLYAPSYYCFGLDYGWDLYRSEVSGYTDKIVPREINGNSPSVTISSTHIKALGHNGDILNHNALLSVIRFSQDFFDRSNIIIWNDQSRASSFYDAVNTKDFHITELDYRILYSYLNDGYKGLLYPHFSEYSLNLDNSITSDFRKRLKGIYLYNKDNKGDNNAKILQYTGDLAAAVLIGNKYSLDTDNYVKIGYYQSSKPMVIFRFDDAFSSQPQLLPLFNLYGIKGVLAITVDMVGTTGYMSWNQIRTFANAGWEILFHSGSNSTTYMTLMTRTELINEIERCIEILSSNGFNVLNWVNHGTNNNNEFAKYVSRDYFNSFSGYKPIVGETGCNSKIIDLYMTKQQIVDMDVASYPYNIEDAGGMAKMKAILDLCVLEGRIAEITAHNHTESFAVKLAEIIEYCISNNISIVTKTEAIANCKFI